MEVFDFKDKKEYVEAQIEANVRKFERHWVTDIEIGIICNYLRKRFKPPELMICHGARNGYEMLKFGYFMGRGTRVIGTDISPTAVTVPNMIQWDFHDINPEWTSKVDMVYCNSLDHSYNPQKAISAWMDSLKKNGIIIVHWAPGHEKGMVKPSDCFHASSEEYESVLSSCGTLLLKEEIKILKGGFFFIVGKK